MWSLAFRSQVSALRTDNLGCCWYSAVALRVATAVLGKKSLCVHTTFLHCAHETLSGFCGYRRHELFTWCEPKHKFDESKNVLMRSGQATPIPLGGNLSRSMMINSLPALPTPSDDLYDTMEIMNPRTVQVESARKRELYAVALDEPRGYENIILRTEYQE